jgi:tRNA G18 (ribose-2'-O)-methylase SpoU
MLKMNRREVRSETRIERYLEKQVKAVRLPASLVAINFQIDENLAYVIRTAACYGIDTVNVIGSIPSRKVLYNPSGSLVDFVKFNQFSTPSQFVSYAKERGWRMVSAELSEGAVSLFDYKFSFEGHTAIVLGNETSGVPAEILLNSDKVFIPMWGPGFCLNTSQTGTAFVNEYCRQYASRR